MKTFVNSAIVNGSPVSGIPERNFRKQLFVQNISPVRIKFGWELDTSWSGLTEGVPLEPGDYRTFGGADLDLRGRLYMVTDDMTASILGDVNEGTSTINGVASANEFLLAGMMIAGPGIPEGTIILEVAGSDLVISAVATSSHAGAALTLAAPVVYTQR